MTRAVESMGDRTWPDMDRRRPIERACRDILAPFYGDNVSELELAVSKAAARVREAVASERVTSW